MRGAGAVGAATGGGGWSTHADGRSREDRSGSSREMDGRKEKRCGQEQEQEQLRKATRHLPP